MCGFKERIDCSKIGFLQFVRGSFYKAKLKALPFKCCMIFKHICNSVRYFYQTAKVKLCMCNNIASVCKDKDPPILIKILAKSFVMILQDPQEKSKIFAKILKIKFLIGILQRSLSRSSNSSHGFPPICLKT